MSPRAWVLLPGILLACTSVEHKVARRSRRAPVETEPAAPATPKRVSTPAPLPATVQRDPLARAEEALAAKNPAAALEILLPLAAANATKLEFQLLLAQAYLGVGKREEALRALGAVQKLDSRHPMAAALICRIRGERRERDTAESACAKAVELAPKDMQSRYLWARALLRMERAADAVRELSDVARAWPDNAEVRLNLGRTLVVLHRWGEARKALEEAIALRRDSTELKDLLARTFVEMGEPKKAAALWREVVAADRSNANARRWFVEALRKSGQLAEAADVLREEAGRDPGSAQLRLELASVEILRGRPSAAVAALGAVLQRQPDNVSALHNLGVLHHQAGRLEPAADALRHAIEIAPDRTDTRLVYANVLELQKKIPEAIAAYEEVVRRAGDSPAARGAAEAIARLKSATAP
jgi:tetratricopeptide (TPR) repeat protein